MLASGSVLMAKMFFEAKGKVLLDEVPSEGKTASSTISEAKHYLAEGDEDFFD